MTLDDWERNRWVTRHQATAREVSDLLNAAAHDLSDAEADEVIEAAKELDHRVRAWLRASHPAL